MIMAVKFRGLVFFEGIHITHQLSYQNYKIKSFSKEMDQSYGHFD